MDADSLKDERIGTLQVPAGHSCNGCPIAGLANQFYDSIVQISIRIAEGDEVRIDGSSQNEFTP